MVNLSSPPGYGKRYVSMVLNTRLTAILTILLLTSCVAKFQPSNGIVLGKRINGIQNGSAYDCATIDVTNFSKLVIPTNAELRRAAESGQVKIYMEKTLGYYGHPVESMTIKEIRNGMGCAFRIKGETLELATYGEWDTNIEGGASIRLLIVAPKSITIETEDSFYGHESIAANRKSPEPVAPDWKTIADSPDTALTLHE